MNFYFKILNFARFLQPAVFWVYVGGIKEVLAVRRDPRKP